MNKHTPGPWWKDGEFVFASGVRICDTSINEQDELPTTDEQAEANARLIAAAPELLELMNVIMEANPEIASVCDTWQMLSRKIEGEESPVFTALSVQIRLEHLRNEIRAERISYSEIAELQSLVEYIKPGDVELLQWAGVPENTEETE